MPAPRGHGPAISEMELSLSAFVMAAQASGGLTTDTVNNLHRAYDKRPQAAQLTSTPALLHPGVMAHKLPPGEGGSQMGDGWLGQRVGKKIGGRNLLR